MDNAPSGPALTPQQKLIVGYLEHGRTLTNVVAITCLEVGSLSSRIAELRRMGYEITDELDTTSDPFGRSFKKYWLTPKREAAEKLGGFGAVGG